MRFLCIDGRNTKMNKATGNGLTTLFRMIDTLNKMRTMIKIKYKNSKRSLVGDELFDIGSHKTKI